MPEGVRSMDGLGTGVSESESFEYLEVRPHQRMFAYPLRT
jgi:hypothetical protein